MTKNEYDLLNKNNNIIMTKPTFILNQISAVAALASAKVQKRESWLKYLNIKEQKVVKIKEPKVTKIKEPKGLKIKESKVLKI